MGSIVAALGSLGHLSYQILTKSGGAPSYRQGPELDDPPVPTAGQPVSACIGDAWLSPICVLPGRATD